MWFFFFFFSEGINLEASAASSGSVYVRPHVNNRNAILVSHRQVSVFFVYVCSLIWYMIDGIV